MNRCGYEPEPFQGPLPRPVNPGPADPKRTPTAPRARQAVIDAAKAETDAEALAREASGIGGLDLGLERAGSTQINGGTWSAWVTCPVCDGVGRCDPIPCTGRQGFWNWEPT